MFRRDTKVNFTNHFNLINHPIYVLNTLTMLGPNTTIWAKVAQFSVPWTPRSPALSLPFRFPKHLK